MNDAAMLIRLQKLRDNLQIVVIVIVAACWPFSGLQLCVRQKVVHVHMLFLFCRVLQISRYSINCGAAGGVGGSGGNGGNAGSVGNISALVIVGFHAIALCRKVHDEISARTNLIEKRTLD